MKKVQSRLIPQFYTAHETNRMKELEGNQLASFRDRGLAIIVDLCVVIVLLLLCLVMALFISGKPQNVKFKFDEKLNTSVAVNRTEEAWARYAVEFGVPLVYWGLLTYLTNGKTIGKWLAGIRVVSTKHEHISLWQSIERALGYSISALEFGFGFLQYFIVPNRRTTHDRIAETIVVQEESGLVLLFRRLLLISHSIAHSISRAIQAFAERVSNIGSK